MRLWPADIVVQPRSVPATSNRSHQTRHPRSEECRVWWTVCGLLCLRNRKPAGQRPSTV
jgi:hypothetical protein